MADMCKCMYVSMYVSWYMPRHFGKIDVPFHNNGNENEKRKKNIQFTTAACSMYLNLKCAQWFMRSNQSSSSHQLANQPIGLSSCCVATFQMLFTSILFENKFSFTISIHTSPPPPPLQLPQITSTPSLLMILLLLVVVMVVLVRVLLSLSTMSTSFKPP